MATTTFTNANGTLLPASGSGETSGLVTIQTVEVSGVSGDISAISITLTGLSHTIPDDLDLMLVAPDGTSFIFMSDAGDEFDMEGVTLVISDEATLLLPDTEVIVGGSYRPANFGIIDDPFPGFVGVPTSATPGGTDTLGSAFGGKNPNGTWTLYASDDFPLATGSLDSWSITITDNPPLPPSNLDISIDLSHFGLVLSATVSEEGEVLGSDTEFTLLGLVDTPNGFNGGLDFVDIRGIGGQAQSWFGVMGVISGFEDPAVSGDEGIAFALDQDELQAVGGTDQDYLIETARFNLKGVKGDGFIRAEFYLDGTYVGQEVLASGAGNVPVSVDANERVFDEIRLSGDGDVRFFVSDADFSVTTGTESQQPATDAAVFYGV